MDFERYLARILELMEVERSTPPTPRTCLAEYGFDSLQCLELVFLTEQLAEVHVPPEAMPVLVTFDDAYTYFCTLVDQTSELSEL